MLSKAYTITLLAAVLAGSVEAGHLRNGHSHKKRADICGTKGYDHDKGNYWYDGGGQYNSYAACSAKCLGEPQCLSFAYSNAECMLFNIPLKGNFDADKGSADTYYDRGCLSAPAVKNKPTTTSTTTTSKSSTVTVAKSSSTSTPPNAAAAKPSSTPKSSSSSTSNTAAVATTPSSAGGAASTPSTTTSAAPDFPTANPYESKGCPMPKALTISDLKSTSDSKTGTNNLASVKIQYGNGTFTCPGRCNSYDGQFNCVCDSDGLLNVASDGKNWIWIQEWYWCDAQEQSANKAYSTLALSLNFTGLADYVTCSKSGTNTTCTQSKPLLAPVGGYGGGGTPGFSPIDINGNDLPNCPYRPGHSQIVTDTAACATATAKP